MAFTQENLDAIDAAIVEAATAGVAELNFGDRGMRRYALKELLDLRTAVKNSITGASGAVVCTCAQFTKG